MCLVLNAYAIINTITRTSDLNEKQVPKGFCLQALWQMPLGNGKKYTKGHNIPQHRTNFAVFHSTSVWPQGATELIHISFSPHDGLYFT